jgi:hypothetical protein
MVVMPRSLTLTGLVAAALLVAFLIDPASAQTYQKYCNDRFGFCLVYPAHMDQEPPPVNNDGRVFYDRQGFRLTASGINNVLEDTLASERLSQERHFDLVSYRADGKDWYVLSGYKGDNIVYLKTYVGPGSINHLHLSYPARLQAAYADLVTRISRSFTPGNLQELH